jgi:hypothetical protein
MIKEIVKTKKKIKQFIEKHYALGQNRYVYEGTMNGTPAELNIMATSKKQSLNKLKEYLKTAKKQILVSRITSFNPKTKKGTIEVLLTDIIG